MVPVRFQAQCEFCQDPLDIRKSGVHTFTSGWVENRRGGGAHAIRLPHKAQRYACKLCIDKESSGISRYQASLFG